MSEVRKVYIEPEQLRRDSFKLGRALLVEDGFKPEFMVALWRGGASIGMFIHEYLMWKAGLHVDHIAIRTSRYTGVDVVGEGPVVVHSTSYLTARLRPGSRLLLVDDVWDSGTTIVAFFEKLERDLRYFLLLLTLSASLSPKNSTAVFLFPVSMFALPFSITSLLATSLL